MLNKFYENEKRSLEKLGAEKQSKQKDFDTETNRLTQIRALYEGMDEPTSQSALYFQNQVRFRDQLRSIIASQTKEVDLAKLEVDNAHVNMMQQFGKVKGLETVLKRRNASEIRQSERREQTANDDISSRSFIQGSLAGNFR